VVSGSCDRRLGRSTEEQRFAGAASGCTCARGDWPHGTGGSRSTHRGVARLGEFCPCVGGRCAGARVEPEHPDVIPALVAGTRDGISFVRSLAAWHLGRLGPRHPGIEVAVPDLRELLNDNDPSVRTEALAALENLAGKGAPPAELKSLSAHR